MSDNITIEIQTEKKVLKAVLRQPGFNEYANAFIAMKTVDGNIDDMKGGKFILETCWVEGDRDEIFNDVKALVSASLEAVAILTVYRTELKKK